MVYYKQIDENNKIVAVGTMSEDIGAFPPLFIKIHENEYNYLRQQLSNSPSQNKNQ